MRSSLFRGALAVSAVGAAALLGSPAARLAGGDALDLGGAEGIEAVHERDADVDFGGLAVGVS